MKNYAHSTKVPATPIGFIWHIIKSHYFLLTSIIILVLVKEIFITSAPFILGKIIDSASNGSGSDTIKQVGELLLLFVFIRFSASMIIRGGSIAVQHILKHIRSKTFRILFSYLSLHSTSYFTNRFAGSISSDVSIVAQNNVKMVSFSIKDFLSTIFAITTSFFIILTANSQIALLFLAGVLLLIPINYQLSRKTSALSKNAAKTFSALRGQLVDSITNIQTVQQFSRMESESSRLDTSIDNYQEASIKSDIYTQKVLGINNILVIIFFIGGLIYYTYTLWVAESISLGEFVMIVTLTTSLIKMLSHVGNIMNEFSVIYGEVKQSLSQILTEHAVKDLPDAKPLSVTNTGIKFADVSFTYEKISEVFNNFSCTIQPEERVGVVGPSGGGKTTLTKLILRQYDISQGEITIGDQDIKTVTQESLRTTIGIVPQETSLFHRSLFENIAYGKEGATLEEVIVAAKKAQIHDFINSLPKKYDTVTGERGIKFSGGQRQRVAIARAILKNAPILILDEATSALDSESEIAVQEGFSKLMKNKTVIAIAHRLSTLKEMDRILVFSEGEIIQDGSHVELMKDSDSMYARLWNHQADGFMNADDETSTASDNVS